MTILKRGVEIEMSGRFGLILEDSPYDDPATLVWVSIHSIVDKVRESESERERERESN